jgi:hypothetical protein
MRKNTEARTRVGAAHSSDESPVMVGEPRGSVIRFLGFDFRRLRGIGRQVWRAHCAPKMKKCTALLRKRKDVLRRFQGFQSVWRQTPIKKWTAWELRERFP